MSSMKIKTVHRIPNTNILINSWRPRAKDTFLRFMTVIRPESTLGMKHIREESYTIYTSVFNRWYLTKFVNVPEHRIVGLECNEPIEIYDKNKKETLKVTAIDANYCVGSAMFLFQGSFGNILYTGFFRPSAQVNIFEVPVLKEIIEQKSMDLVYIDNTYAAERCEFPRRAELVEKIIDLLRDHPNHYVFICGKRFGKEEVLYDIVTTLQEKICVTREKFEFLQEMGLEELFTTDCTETRIIALDYILNPNQCRKKKEEHNPCLIILLTAYYEFRKQRNLPLDDLYILPYSGHCSHSELMQFLSVIKPGEIKPVVVEDDINSIYCKIPQCIYDLCCKSNDLRQEVLEPEIIQKFPEMGLQREEGLLGIQTYIPNECTWDEKGSKISDLTFHSEDLDKTSDGLIQLQKVLEGLNLLSEKNYETTIAENQFSTHAQNLCSVKEYTLDKKNHCHPVENVDNVDDAVIDDDSEFVEHDHSYATDRKRRKTNLSCVAITETDDNMAIVENCESYVLCNVNPFKTGFNSEVCAVNEHTSNQKSNLKSNYDRLGVIRRDRTNMNNESESILVQNFFMNDVEKTSNKLETDGNNIEILNKSDIRKNIEICSLYENIVTTENRLPNTKENINQFALNYGKTDANYDDGTIDKNTYTIKKHSLDANVNSSQCEIGSTENYFADESEFVESEDVCAVNKNTYAADEDVPNSEKNLYQMGMDSIENYYADESTCEESDVRMINEGACGIKRKTPHFERNSSVLEMDFKKSYFERKVSLNVNETDGVTSNVNDTDNIVKKAFVNETDLSGNFNMYSVEEVNTKTIPYQRPTSNEITTSEIECNANNKGNAVHEICVIENTYSIKKRKNRPDLFELSNLRKYNSSTVVTKGSHLDRTEETNYLLEKRLRLNVGENGAVASLCPYTSTKNDSECERVAVEPLKSVNRKADQSDINEYIGTTNENWKYVCKNNLGNMEADFSFVSSSPQQDISEKRIICATNILAPDTNESTEVLETSEEDTGNYDGIRIIPDSDKTVVVHPMEKSNNEGIRTDNHISHFYTEHPVKLNANNRIIPDLNELAPENDENLLQYRTPQEPNEQNEKNFENNFSYTKSVTLSKKNVKLNADTNLIVSNENEQICMLLKHYVLINEVDAYLTIDRWSDMNSNVIESHPAYKRI